ncbi:MAG: IS110 family transposase [Longimicrobiales bacterium]
MQRTAKAPERTIGLDVSDRTSHLCVLDGAGEVVEETRVPTTSAGLSAGFGRRPPTRVVLEVGPHSPWITRLLQRLGHDVIVANPRKLRFIYQNDRKSDRADAEYLARVGRLDPTLLAPVQHRGAEAQADLAVIRSRSGLVEARTALINHVRSSVKAVGSRLPACSTESFHWKVEDQVPEELQPALIPVIDTIAELTARIREMERWLDELANTVYPETALLTQVRGVGTLTALAYMLTLEAPERFPDSRAVGPYLGLVPRRHDSGDSSPELSTTKAGDRLLRTLLVQSAHYILGPFGPDTDLRRWGLRLAERGGQAAKQRAVVAVARKLAVLLHRLWLTGEVYQPLRNAEREAREEAAA